MMLSFRLWYTKSYFTAVSSKAYYNSHLCSLFCMAEILGPGTDSYNRVIECELHSPLMDGCTTFDGKHGSQYACGS